MKPLTPRQTEVFELIRRHINDTGMPPTRAEIAKELGFRSANAAEEHLRALAKKGAIEMIPGASRGIRISEAYLPASANEATVEPELGLPLIGQVAAGEPILAQEHVESHYAVDASLFNPHADYLLRVQGMSMKDIGIMDGDLLAVHKTTQVHNGQVVVARLDEDVTVKRFERDGKMVYLHPENEELSTIEVDLEYQNIEIEGLAVGIIRTADWM
ncbi:LexA repressor [Agarivorans sp. Toyoura001]|uniref:transcriptional repressor LexA n=1 Tax=Agarivorans sp. Toyoura001 TaxID=2283141 RepID=UPI0010DDDCAF|nr:transcriptional repressor LexA [Agarivorans sp. Toyoura001]GDY27687.1 LexA repressor [Agarivorans sp. Toyoura001]